MVRSTAIVLLAGTLAAGSLLAQGPSTTPFDRLPAHLFDVTPPSARVAGYPGAMTPRPSACRSLPIASARQRIVALSVQEWGYFGFPIVEYDDDEEDAPVAGRGGPGAANLPAAGSGNRRSRGPSRIGTPEAARTAASIGGYWAVTPGGAWILENQNQYWREAISGVTRWRFPWSAAFISWLMCEGGIGAPEAFQRAIAHHTYIDQAIRARDGRSNQAVYVAYDPGESAIAPGDLLCSSRRPVFRTLADRRRQLGQGARTHCDLVVKVDEAGNRILAIGGNVRGVVGLKIIPAARAHGRLQPALPASMTRTRPLFAHLKLRGSAEPAALAAFDESPTLRAIACAGGTTPAVRVPTQVRQATPPARCGG